MSPEPILVIVQTVAAIAFWGSGFIFGYAMSLGRKPKERSNDA